MAYKINFRKKFDFLRAEMAFCTEEASINGLAAGATDGGHQAPLIVRSQRADFDRAPIREGLDHRIFGRVQRTLSVPPTAPRLPVNGKCSARPTGWVSST